MAYRGRLKGAAIQSWCLKPLHPTATAVKLADRGGQLRRELISGVRVVTHKETPGLGDYIDIAKNQWISLFAGASHQRYRKTTGK